MTRSTHANNVPSCGVLPASAITLLRDGGSSLDAVERMVVELECCPLFNAGIGGVLNREGLPELRRCDHDGRDRQCGAVAGVSRSKSPVRLARAIMERSPHVCSWAQAMMN